MKDQHTTLAQLQVWARDELRKVGVASGDHEVNLLLMAATGLDKSGLISSANQTASDEVRGSFVAYVKRRIQREPVFRILGRREFHSLELDLNEATLEPRDDTECLVELALAQVQDRTAPLRLLDLGTGTGAVALALLRELPNATATATDLEPNALKMATSNAKKNELADRFSTLQSNWFEQVTGRYDLIVSNPPYIATDELQHLELEVVRFDPALALDGGADGLDAYRQILSKARDYLVEDGILALEIGRDQRHSVSKLASANDWKVTQTARDLAGCDRALCLR